MADGHLLCPTGRSGSVRTTRHSRKGRAYGTQGRLEQCWKSCAGTSSPRCLPPTVCSLLPVPSSLQGDRGFDGQQGAKGDQGEKGDRVSRLERDRLHCTTLYQETALVGSVSEPDALRRVIQRCSKLSHQTMNDSNSLLFIRRHQCWFFGEKSPAVGSEDVHGICSDTPGLTLCSPAGCPGYYGCPWSPGQ